MAFIGNTVRIKGTFRDWNGALGDPTGLTLKLYDQLRNQIGATLSSFTHEGTGVYHYDYVIPDVQTPYLVYEWAGTLSGTPILGRGEIPVRWA